MDTNISLNPWRLLYFISSFLLIFQGFSYGRQIYSLKKCGITPCIRFFQHYILMRQEKPLFFFCFLKAVLNYILSSWPVFLQRSVYAREFSSSISFIFVAMLWVHKIIFERKWGREWRGGYVWSKIFASSDDFDERLCGLGSSARKSKWLRGKRSSDMLLFHNDFFFFDFFSPLFCMERSSDVPLSFTSCCFSFRLNPRFFTEQKNLLMFLVLPSTKEKYPFRLVSLSLKRFR